MNILPKVKLGKVGVDSNIAQNHFAQSKGSHIWSLFVPIHVKGCQNVDLCQVGLSSNIAPYQSHGLLEVNWKVDQKRTYVIFGSVRTLLKITHY